MARTRVQKKCKNRSKSVSARTRTRARTRERARERARAKARARARARARAGAGAKLKATVYEQEPARSSKSGRLWKGHNIGEVSIITLRASHWYLVHSYLQRNLPPRHKGRILPKAWSRAVGVVPWARPILKCLQQPGDKTSVPSAAETSRAQVNSF